MRISRLLIKEDEMKRENKAKAENLNCSALEAPSIFERCLHFCGFNKASKPALFFSFFCPAFSGKMHLNLRMKQS